MSPYQGRRVFRSPRWVLAMVAASALLFAIGAWFHLRAGRRDLPTLVFVLLTVFGVFGIVETSAQRVELSDDAMHVTRWWIRRSYPRGSITRATHEKGGPAAIQLADGRWVNLPSVGAGMANSIRAWLRANGSNAP